MLKRYTAGICLILMLGWCAPPADAENEDQRHVTWDGLSEIVGQNVHVVMPDGARIEGRATKLEADALEVEIRKTTNKAAYPKGKFLVARATLKAVDVDRNTKGWRITGLAIGGTIGVLFCSVFLKTSGADGRRATLDVAAAAGLTAGGYLLGRMADRHAITYVITP
jgi:hypothetical protein